MWNMSYPLVNECWCIFTFLCQWLSSLALALRIIVLQHFCLFIPQGDLLFRCVKSCLRSFGNNNSLGS